MILTHFLLLILYFAKAACYQSNYSFEVPTRFPDKPKYPVGNRTAIIINGELRSGNITFKSGLIEARAFVELRDYFSKDDPRTPIDTMLQDLISPLALFGGVDVFIYIPVKCHESEKAAQWDGDPKYYEPYLGDTRVCELYNNHPAFHEHTGNKVFCMTECTFHLLDIFTESREDWKPFANYNTNGANEIFLQQEYGKYRGNLAVKQYSVSYNIKYRYKIRLRHDEGMIRQFPSLDEPNLWDITCPYSRHVYYPDYQVYGFSAQDSFNFGEVREMDLVMDRYIELLDRPIEVNPQTSWVSEFNLYDTLGKRYQVCLVAHKNIYMSKIRIKDNGGKMTLPKSNPMWIKMPPSKVVSKEYIVPKYPLNNRTAIIISGELNAGNISFSSGKLSSHNGLNDNLTENKTSIDTVIENVIVPFALFGGVDVFIYTPADCTITESERRQHFETYGLYHPEPSDTSICELFSKHPIFQNTSGNHVYCLVECKSTLWNIFIQHDPVWKNISLGSDPRVIEQFLQVEYGKYRANFASKENALARKEKYQYKVRIHLDEIVILPLTHLELLYSKLINNNKRTIHIGDSNIHGHYSIDSFVIGFSEDMDRFFDSYIDLITLPIFTDSLGRWSPESHSIASLKTRYGIEIAENNHMQSARARLKHHSGVKFGVLHPLGEWKMLAAVA